MIVMIFYRETTSIWLSNLKCSRFYLFIRCSPAQICFCKKHTKAFNVWWRKLTTKVTKSEVLQCYYIFLAFLSLFCNNKKDHKSIVILRGNHQQIDFLGKEFLELGVTGWQDIAIYDKKSANFWYLVMGAPFVLKFWRQIRGSLACARNRFTAEAQIRGELLTRLKKTGVPRTKCPKYSGFTVRNHNVIEVEKTGFFRKLPKLSSLYF